ncbi:MAG: YfcC family protein [Clostridia bacterium]|nr:YfcC family protein [Clostridia bacterium]
MNKQTSTKEANPTSKPLANISLRSFVTVVLVLLIAIIACTVLSYVIPQGSFLRDADGNIIADSYTPGQIQGIAVWRVITAPIRVFAGEDALNVIVISLFLLIMSGVFNLLEKTGGVRIFIERILRSLGNKARLVICITVLIFMAFGSLFGMFEELVTLLPIVIIFMLSMGMDTMMGLGACMLAACFGFSAATTNPFSVGIASNLSGQSISDGIGLRIVFFFLTYGLICAFLLLHYRKIKRDPSLSPSYDIDNEKRKQLESTSGSVAVNENRVFTVYLIFFAVQALVLILITAIRSLSSLSVPILAVSFLVFGTVSGLIVCSRRRDVATCILKGAASMLPAVLMIALASSVKLIMTESGIIDTIMHYVIDLLDGKNPFFAVLLIYLLILILQIFIASASAKIFLVMPIVMPIATAIGLSPSMVILAYCMADGFTDVILPTNPILIVGLSMANVPYSKWVKWTWKLQAIVLALTVAVLFFGIAIGY